MRPFFTTRLYWHPVAQCGQVVRTRWISQERYSRRRFIVMAPVGQAPAQLPQDSQFVLFQSSPKGARMEVRTPLRPVIRVWLPAALLQAPTQRWQRMQSAGLKAMKGFESRIGPPAGLTSKGVVSTPSSRQRSCSSQLPFFGQLKQYWVVLSPWSAMMSWSAVRRAAVIASELVCTTMPGLTRVLQEDTRPAVPSTSTTQSRQEPMELTFFR